MEFFDVLRERHSIRAYTDRQIGPASLQQILEAANAAPSAGNLQAYEVYVVSDPERKEALRRAALDQDFLAWAPVVLVFCAHPPRSAGRYGKRGAELYCVQDASIACTYAMLSATALGLSSVWVGAFVEEAVRAAIGAPEAHRPVAMLPIGFAAESPRQTRRRSLSDLVHREIC